VCPIAPDGELFFRGSQSALTALLDEIAKTFAVESGRVHVAGISNGGRSAFRLATLAPQRIASLVASPGYPPDDADFDALGALVETPIAMFAGGADTEWVAAMRRVEGRMRELGAREATLTVFEGEGHVPPSFTGARLLALLERFRDGERERAAAELAIGALLDDFHGAAARADLERYFAALAPDAVFIGTDATERWTAASFRAFVEPYFRRGQGWTYAPLERHVSVGRGGAIGWFDERLANDKYGEVRGSGVVRRLAGGWRVAHYVLSFAVPNDASAEVVERIRARSKGR
jgi:dienelactone hydrolase